MYMYVCMYVYMYIYIYIYIYAARRRSERSESWLRTNEVNTNGAAAKVMNFAGLENRYILAFEYQKTSLSTNIKFTLTPLVPTPFVPFREERKGPICMYMLHYTICIHIYIYIYLFIYVLHYYYNIYIYIYIH